MIRETADSQSRLHTTQQHSYPISVTRTTLPEDRRGVMFEVTVLNGANTKLKREEMFTVVSRPKKKKHRLR